MKNINDYFQQVAFSLGYKPQDLLPIQRQIVEFQSQKIIQAMSQKEKEFYINKKIVSMMNRQNKIINQVQNQIKKRQFSYIISKNQHSKHHNPTVANLMERHDKIMQRNLKYINTLFRKKQIQKNKQQKRLSISSNNNLRNSNTVSIRSNKSSVSNRSNQSKISNKSAQSNRSNKSTASHKERLIIVREKQRQKNMIMKQINRQRQLQISQKSLRAGEQRIRQSQKIKARSMINKQIVQQNRRDLQYMKNLQIKDHLQQLKYKIQKTELIRSKNHEKKQQSEMRKTNYKEIKTKIEQQNRKIYQHLFNEKNRKVSQRLVNQQIIKKEALNYNTLTQNLKLQNAKKNRYMKQSEDKHFGQLIKKNQEKRLMAAELKRYYLKDKNKEKFIEGHIKQQLNTRNRQSFNQRRANEIQQLKLSLDKKFNKIDEIQIIKDKLHKQRKKVQKQLKFQKNQLQNSNNNNKNRFKINSFFDIQ